MSLVLAAIVITIFAAIFVPTYLFPVHDVFQASVSQDSPYGFTLHLSVNSTSVQSGGTVLINGWVNSTSSTIENVTAANSWGLPQPQLWGRLCTSYWPLGVGVLRGHYTTDNYTLGTLVPLPRPLTLVACKENQSSPAFFLFEPHSSRVLFTQGGSPYVWVLQTSLGVRVDATGTPLAPGVYTAVLADEWGDVLTTNFLVS